MTRFEVRPFRRSDRDQLTSLVNAHVGAVVPGASLSVNAVLSQLEREPAEFVVDPWVKERATLVVEHRGRVGAAAHLLVYGGGDEVGETYRELGEIRWLVFWPEAPFWPEGPAAGDAVLAAGLSWLEQAGAQRVSADGALPAPGVFGLPEQWPHVHAALRQAGFVADGRTEIVLLVDAAALARPAPPLGGLHVTRTLGVSGTRLMALLDGEVVGYVEVDTQIAEAGRIARQGGWADVANLWVAEAYRRRGIGTWLLGVAAEWLRLGHISRLLAYADPATEDAAFFAHAGFCELTRTVRGYERPNPTTPSPR